MDLRPHKNGGIARDSEEFHDVREYFETTGLKHLPCRSCLEREPGTLHVFYCNGEVNLAFKAFLLGYSLAKSIYQRAGEPKE